MVLFRTKRGDNAHNGRAVGKVELLAQFGIGRPRAEPIHVNAVGNHAEFRRRTAFVLGKVTRVRLGHGDEGVGQRRQQAVGELHAVGPTGGVQRGSHNGHSGQSRRQASPEHLVARADGDDRVDAAALEQSASRQSTPTSVFLRSKS